MRRAQNADTHAPKQHRLSQKSSPLLQFYTGQRTVTSILSLKAKNGWKTMVFTLQKMPQKKQHFFSIFRRFLVTWQWSYILWSDQRLSLFIAVPVPLATHANSRLLSFSVCPSVRLSVCPSLCLSVCHTRTHREAPLTERDRDRDRDRERQRERERETDRQTDRQT